MITTVDPIVFGTIKYLLKEMARGIAWTEIVHGINHGYFQMTARC